MRELQHGPPRSIIGHRVHSWSLSHGADGLFGRVLGSLTLTWSAAALIVAGGLCASQNSRIADARAHHPAPQTRTVACETLTVYDDARLVRCVSETGADVRIPRI